MNTGRSKQHHGRNVELVRWSIKKAAEEFDTNQATLTGKLKSAGILPNPQDQCFSTMDIVTAIYGGLSNKLKAEQIKDTRESAALKNVRKQNLLRENIPVAMVEKVWSDFIVDLVQKINNQDLPDKVRKEILADLQQIDTEKYFDGKVAEKDSDEDVE